MLRYESASSALPAMRRNPLDETSTSSASINLRTMADDRDCDEDFEENENGKQSRRGRMCCAECLAEGRGKWHVKKRGNPRIGSAWFCSNTVCSRYSSDDNITAPNFKIGTSGWEISVYMYVPTVQGNAHGRFQSKADR